MIESCQYRAQFLLPKVRDLGLDQEAALLYGKVRKNNSPIQKTKAFGILLLWYHFPPVSVNHALNFLFLPQ